MAPIPSTTLMSQPTLIYLKLTKKHSFLSINYTYKGVLVPIKDFRPHKMLDKLQISSNKKASRQNVSVLTDVRGLS